MTEGNYPRYRHHLNLLMKRMSKELPGLAADFEQLHSTSLNDGVLSRKSKELTALGIAIAARCDACIAYHVHGALRAGATRPEIVETIGVAIMMGGAPATMYGCEAFEALEQFKIEFAEERASRRTDQEARAS